MNKCILSLLLFAFGLGLGMFFNPKRHTLKDEKVSSSNWISRYDLYDYENAVLTDGDIQKLSEIIGESDVERLPYIITMYDVHKKDVCIFLLQIFSLYYGDIEKRNAVAMSPLKVFVNSVVSEYERKGKKFNMREIEEYVKRLK